MQPYLVQILLANHSLLTKFQLHCLYQIYMRCIFTISVRYTWRSKLHMYPGSVSRDRVRNIYSVPNDLSEECLTAKKTLSKHERLLWRRFVVAVEAVQQAGGLHHPNAGIKLMVSGRPSSVPNHDAEIVYCTIMVHAMAL